MSEEKVHKFENEVKWTSQRKGVLDFPPGEKPRPQVEVGSPPEFSGHPGVISPEDLLVSSVNTCIMLGFLAFADRMRLDIVSYDSHAEGELDMGIKPPAFRCVRVYPRVEMKAGESREKVERALELARKYCFVSNSMKCEVTVESEIGERAEGD